MGRGDYGQAAAWGASAEVYDQLFLIPYADGVENPLLKELASLRGTKRQVAADLGCGTGPLLPFLSARFQRVFAVDFSARMLDKARERHPADNVAFVHGSLTELSALGVRELDVAVAVNSLVLPEIGELHRAFAAIYQALQPGGFFLGIVPAMDSVMYLGLIAYEAARREGKTHHQARRRALVAAEARFYDPWLGIFRFRGTIQKFYHHFELWRRLEQAGFCDLYTSRVLYPWNHQLACPPGCENEPPPWDWFFRCRKPK